MEKLKQFLIKAKKKTYASLISFPKKIPGGGKKYQFKKGDFSYQDIYYGEKSFTGEEIVFFKEIPIWSMNYFGGIKIEDLRKECYRFLKYCLKKLPSDFPARGLNNLSKGKLKYENHWEGNLKNFKGTEKIFYEDKEIYSLEYHGGLLKF